jgi:hypothetical protein
MRKLDEQQEEFEPEVKRETGIILKQQSLACHHKAH